MLHTDKAYIRELRARIESGRDSELQAMLSELHPTDVAEVFDMVRPDEAEYLFRLLNNEGKSDVLIELETDVREDLLSNLTAAEIAGDVLEGLDSDDAADVMAGLPEEKAEEVIRLIEDDEQASDIRDLLNYAEGTAGALMAKELVKVFRDWTVNRAIREIRRQRCSCREAGRRRGRSGPRSRPPRHIARAPARRCRRKDRAVRRHRPSSRFPVPAAAPPPAWSRQPQSTFRLRLPSEASS